VALLIPHQRERESGGSIERADETIATPGSTSRQAPFRGSPAFAGVTAVDGARSDRSTGAGNGRERKLHRLPTR